MKPELVLDDYVAAAEPYGIDPLYLAAVAEVESGSGGFLGDDSPKILFEGHVFWRRLTKRGINPQSVLKRMSEAKSVLYRRWTRRFYLGGEREYRRLTLASRIDELAACESASWGRFQVMGFHAERLGYKDAMSFAGEMFRGEERHLEAFMRYCKAFGLIDELQRQDSEGFARGYNGPAYAENRYDEKIEKAYRQLKRRAA